MKLIYFLTLSSLFFTVSSSILAPVEMFYLQRFTNQYAIIGTIIGLPALIAIILSPLMGRLSDLIGRKKIIITFSFIGSFTPLFLLYSWSVLSYASFKVLSGLFGASGAVISAFLGDLLKKGRRMGFWIGIYAVGASFGGAIGCLLSGSLAFLYGLKASYWLGFMFSILSFIFLLPIIKQKEIFPIKKTKGRFSPLRKKSFAFPSIIYFVFVLIFLGSFHLSMKGFLWPVIAKQFVTEKLAVLYVSLIFAGMGIIAGITNPYFGSLGDKIGYKKIMFLGWTICAVIAVLFSFTNSIIILFIFSLFFSLGESMKGPAIFSILTNYTKKSNRGFVFGLNSSISSLASFLGPSITGILAQLFGWRVTLLIYGIAFLIPLVFVKKSV